MLTKGMWKRKSSLKGFLKVAQINLQLLVFKKWQTFENKWTSCSIMTQMLGDYTGGPRYMR